MATSEVTSEGFLKVAHASAPSTALPRVPSLGEVENDRVLALISRASASAPPALAVYLKQAAPAIALMWKFINLVAPLYVAMWAMCMRVYETLPFELLEALMGLGMCFAGGAYCTSIAAVEAFRMTGWETTRRALRDVYAEAKNVQAAHSADDKKDDDRDGKADVLALAPAELLQRKVKVLALAVKDPDKMMAALGGLYTSWLAVQGTLRLQYAKTITLGVSIANELEKPAMSWLVPIVVPLIPPACASMPRETPHALRPPLRAPKSHRYAPPLRRPSLGTDDHPGVDQVGGGVYCVAAADRHLGRAVVHPRRPPRRAQDALLPRPSRPHPRRGRRRPRRGHRVHPRRFRLLHAVAVGLRLALPAQPDHATLHADRVVHPLDDHGLERPLTRFKAQL